MSDIAKNPESRLPFATAERRERRTFLAWPAAANMLVLTLITVAVLYLRQPGQFSSPYIWAEDGMVVLPDFAKNGLWSLFTPVGGYFIASDKLIIVPAYAISILWAPEIALIGTALLTVAVVLSVAFAPTHLRWPPLCAIACLLIPSGPEVFAKSLHTYWWAGLWVVLALLWDAQAGRPWLRQGLLVLGGLSSPIIIPLSLLFLARAAVERRKSEYIASAIALAVALVQASAIALADARLRGAASMSSLYSLVATATFPGYFIAPLAPSETAAIFFGVAAILAFALAAMALRDRLGPYFWILLAALLLIVLEIVIRRSAIGIHPSSAGVRYYFYPFVLMAWLLIWMAAVSGFTLRMALLSLLGISGLQGIPSFSRHSDAVNWREQIAACAAAETYDLPIHTGGRKERMWRKKMLGSQCRQMIDSSLFGAIKRRP